MKEILRITFPVGSRLPLICHEEIRYEGFILPPHVSNYTAPYFQILIDYRQAFPSTTAIYCLILMYLMIH